MNAEGKLRRQSRLLERLLEERSRRPLHFTLIDPHKTSPREAAEIALNAKNAGSNAILVGGSIGVYEPRLSEVVRSIKRAGLPIILFPGNINGLTPEADGVLFMYLMNTSNVYYVTGAQVQAAPIVMSMGLEPIPTAYIIVGYGGAAGYIGMARPIPYDKPEIVAAYSLAGAMMGARIIYLEAGSGAPQPVPVDAVKMSVSLIRKAGLDSLIIVGGGIRDGDKARKIIEAGADGIVTGNITEEDPSALEVIIKSIMSS
ncbi:MAG: geranylgeranylglyceryl/heptaprenylglyceryl phosphate synthase [Desulfurococcales archaeon]|nr:geranylgeranylglyceryl/heptaprenylglyceryl phosphate synthase [Desulfurococcales archaeon]